MTKKQLPFLVVDEELPEINIIDGEQSCWRCGVSKKDFKREKFVCNHWGISFKNHLWKIKQDNKTKT